MTGRSARYPSTSWAVRRLYRPFVLASLAVALTLGFSTGALLLAAPARGAATSASLAQAHGFAQLFGWAGLAVMGFSFHVVPRFRGSPRMPSPWPQRATLVLVGGAVALRFAGALAADRELDVVAGTARVVSAAALLAGAVVFAAVVGGVLRRGTRSAVPFERWSWASLVWLLVAAGVHLAGAAAPASEGGAVEARWNTALIHAALYGFIGCAIFGVSLRAIAGFASLRPRHARLERAAFVLANAGTGAGVAGRLAGAEEAGAAGDVALAAGLLAFVIALRIFEQRVQARDLRAGAYERWERAVALAYAWLVAGALLLAVEALASLDALPALPRAAPVLHVVALGFVSTMIMGFGARALPLFEGRPLTRHAALDLALVALNASVASRAYYTLVRPSAEGLAVSGVLGLAGLACFAAAVAPLLLGRRDGRGERIAVRRPSGGATRPGA